MRVQHLLDTQFGCGLSKSTRVAIQVGTSARLPLNGAQILQRVRSQPSLQSQPSDEGDTRIGSMRRALIAPLAPVVRGVRVQPIARVRAEATFGRFRRWVFDHTSVAAELEAGLRHPKALGLWEFDQRASDRAGIVHLASVSAKQQLVGPVRAYADLRWELSADGGPSEHGPKGERAPTPAFGSRARCHVANLRPHKLDAVFGVDFGAGPASLAAWFSPLRKQGLVELRI